jgi:hypothetical protein
MQRQKPERAFLPRRLFHHDDSWPCRRTTALEHAARSVGLQEKIDFPGNSSLNFVEGAVAFIEYIVTLIAFIRYCSLDGIQFEATKLKGIDRLLSYFCLCRKPNLHERVDDNRHELPGSISEELIVAAIVDFCEPGGHCKEYVFLKS